MASLLAPIVGHDFSDLSEVCARPEFAQSGTSDVAGLLLAYKAAGGPLPTRRSGDLMVAAIEAALPADLRGLSLDDCRRLATAIGSFAEERVPGPPQRGEDGFVRFLFSDGSDIVLSDEPQRAA